MPFPERYEVGEATVAAIARARSRGGRVVAVGTSVVRALEAASETGTLRAGEGQATLVLGPIGDEPLASDRPRLGRPRVVDSVLSGMHCPGESHFELLSVFAPPALLEQAGRHAAAHGYRSHEFGDACLVLGPRSY